ncbi:PIN domain-containing protein [Sphingobium sp. H39-3-25]|uniref:PIN domain-containing protein n=1 Tax=Sphingobium arseniciresistens TaxID=3030834 RepID=UPI0023B8A7BE|nr:PIN domain-containing protein [Sphingobium arseniciresistens]|tara:strand:+ start:65815 stop:66873 length:1059 start_codon:yes stop_codon:yes gene_type:complete
MTKPKKSPHIFLDANIVIAAGKPPGGPELDRVKDLVDAGLVRMLTTDLTITEVAKKHAQNDFDLIRSICQPHFRDIVAAATGAKLPSMKNGELRTVLKERYEAQTLAMFKALCAQTLKVDDVKPSAVLDAYSQKTGFFLGEGKKDQFPDAFLFECLKQIASKKTPVIIVSADGDFAGPVKDAEHISLVKSLPALFEALGLEMAAPEIDAFLDGQNEALVGLINDELTSWGLQSDDVMDTEIDDIVVEGVEVSKVTAFKPLAEGGSILAIAKAGVRATISYTHPNWDEAMWDSEDKIAIPYDTVSGETEIELSIDIALSLSVDGDGEIEEIDGLRFRSANFQYVTLYPPDNYK